MAFVFIIAGIVLLIAGVRDTASNSDGTGLFQLLQNDFDPSAQKQGQHSFLAWLTAILVIGAIGYVEDLKPFSRAFLVLVIIALFLAKNQSGTATGETFFAQLQKLTNATGATTGGNSNGG